MVTKGVGGEYVTDKKDLAYQDFINGMKYTEIAAKYEVSESAVKQWARRYWNKKVTPEKVTKGKKVTQPPPRKKGGQSGNKNTLKHGAYKKVSWDILEDDEERELIESIDFTPEEILKNGYKTSLLRERRLLKKSLEYKEKSKNNQNLILGSVTKIKGSRSDGEEDKTITVAESESNVFKIYEAELTKIQGQQIKIAVELKKMMIEDKKTPNLDDELFNDNMISLAQIIRQPLAPHEINTEGGGDEH